MIYLRIREAAEERGYTVGDLAQMAHIRTTLMLAYWRNPYKIIDTYMLDKIAIALDVPAEQLIRSVKEPEIRS